MNCTVAFLIFEEFHSTIGLIHKNLKTLGQFVVGAAKSGIGLILSWILAIENFNFCFGAVFFQNTLLSVFLLSFTNKTFSSQLC